MSPTWRRLESSIIEWVRAGGYEVLEKRASGDIYITIDEPCEVNLTELAKEMALGLEEPQRRSK